MILLIVEIGKPAIEKVKKQLGNIIAICTIESFELYSTKCASFWFSFFNILGSIVDHHDWYRYLQFSCVIVYDFDEPMVSNSIYI